MIINKDWKIESSTMNIVLFKRRIGKSGKSKGKDIWEEEGYFSPTAEGLRYAIKRLVDYEVLNTELKDIKAVHAKQAELHTLIDNLNLTGEKI